MGPGFNSFGGNMWSANNQQADPTMAHERMAKQQADTTRYGADLANQLGKAQLAQKGNQFNTVWGGLSGLLGGLNGSHGSSVGGTNTPQAAIDTSPIWNQDQINQQVNQSRAQSLQGAQGQQQAMAAKMSGQGFGSQSPALLQMQNNAMSQALGQAASNENNQRWAAAQGNASHVLNAQKAGEQNWADYNQADIERRKTSTGYATGLMSALAGLI